MSVLKTRPSLTAEQTLNTALIEIQKDLKSAGTAARMGGVSVAAMAATTGIKDKMYIVKDELDSAVSKLDAVNGQLSRATTPIDARTLRNLNACYTELKDSVNTLIPKDKSDKKFVSKMETLNTAMAEFNKLAAKSQAVATPVRETPFLRPTRVESPPAPKTAAVYVTLQQPEPGRTSPTLTSAHIRSIGREITEIWKLLKAQDRKSVV